MLKAVKRNRVLSFPRKQESRMLAPRLSATKMADPSTIFGGRGGDTPCETISRGARLLLIVFLSFLSIGAWWQFGKPKARPAAQKEEAAHDQEQVVSPVVSQPKIETVSETKVPLEAEKQKKSAESEEKSIAESPPVPSVSAEKQSEEVKKIQGELRQVIRQTGQLQAQVRDNRAEIQQILERARIHEKILRSISAPSPIRTVQQINTDEILRREKLRLIAEQAQQARSQLQTIQRARPPVQTPRLPVSVKSSKTS